MFALRFYLTINNLTVMMVSGCDGGNFYSGASLQCHAPDTLM